VNGINTQSWSGGVGSVSFENSARRIRRIALLVLLLSAVCSACPVCHSVNGGQLRAALFGPAFWPNLLRCVLPFPLWIGIVALVYRRFPIPEAAVRPEKIWPYKHH
jgi:hypothetical protein